MNNLHRATDYTRDALDTAAVASIVANTKPIPYDPNNPEHRDKLAELIRDAMPEMCEACGGYKADETTPGWVYKEHEICDCAHEHRYSYATHIPDFTPLEGLHDCELCSICGHYACEVPPC